MKRSAWIAFYLLLFSAFASAQKGHEIKVKIDGFQQPELYLGYYLQDKQYILDTATIGKDGFYTFAGEGISPGGLFLVVMPPENQFFQILIDKDNQQFSVHCKNPKNPVEGMAIKGSVDNSLFYDYLNYLAVKRPEAIAFQQLIDNPDKTTPEKDEAQRKLDQLNESVQEYQTNIISKYPKTLTAAVIKSNLPMDIPEFEGEQKEVDVKKWRYAKNHYFDNFDLADPRMLRTPFLFQRLEHYVNKMTVQHPDSINQALFYLLEKMKPAEETFKY
jgi:hypothetical protein